MPVGYIEPRKILFHTALLPREISGMNRLQEWRKDSQISPRKPARPSGSFQTGLQPEQ
jgi:hypothetical protein